MNNKTSKYKLFKGQHIDLILISMVNGASA